MATNSQRMNWILDHLYLDHDYGKTYLAFENEFVSENKELFEKWGRACIGNRKAGKRELILKAIDNAIDMRL